MLITMSPIIKRPDLSSMTSRKIRRRKKECSRSNFVAISMCVVIIAMSSIVHGFTIGTNFGTNFMPTNGQKVRFSFTTSVGQKRYQQEVAPRAASLVLTSSKSSDLDGSTINGSSPSSFSKTDKNLQGISKFSAFLSKIGMMAYIASMCLALPIALFPPYLLHRIKLISKVGQQNMALTSAQFCARWLLRLIPFCNVKCFSSPEKEVDPQPSVWVCNHTSALDIFILLARDFEMRGKKKRPIKIVYWKGLESNPITKLLFTQCGFIPVQMEANDAGDNNNYDLKSFKTLLKMSKQAFEEGFDIGILPEGQLNPNPEEKLLPCFPGAYTLAKMSKRPIRFFALHGTHRLWHAREDIGMTVTGRDISIRVYPGEGRKFGSADEFLATFEAVVGKFATTGKDSNDDELNAWLDGSKWEETKATGDEK
mmetsp:Transcript_17702/g.40841  ORF Transcript_17702/g.40841 Transcript_17702/m.40841 type:complete len:424 (-) Transcript_17702:89-1360(-)